MLAICPECGKAMTVRPLIKAMNNIAFPVHWSRGSRCLGSGWVVEDEDFVKEKQSA